MASSRVTGVSHRDVRTGSGHKKGAVVVTAPWCAVIAQPVLSRQLCRWWKDARTSVEWMSRVWTIGPPVRV